MSLIITNGPNKPVLHEFSNITEKLLYHKYDNFEIIEDKLYYRAKNAKNQIAYRFCLPENSIKLVLKHFHDSVFSGHLGLKKTSYRILSRYYYPKLKKLIIAYVKSCDTCQRVKNTQPKRRGLLNFLKPTRPIRLLQFILPVRSSDPKEVFSTS